MALPRMRAGIEYRGVGFRYADAPRRRAAPGRASARAAARWWRSSARAASGKTTLVNLLPRFYDVTEGAILIDGVDVRAGDARQPARADRARDAGDGAVQRHRARQHRLRHGRRRRGARRVGGARGLRPRLHPGPAAPLRHRDRRARQPALGRPEAAHRDRARDPEGPADPDPGRGHLRARRASPSGWCRAPSRT